MDFKLPESRERQVFLELLTQPKSPGGEVIQLVVADRHGLSIDTVRAIERKGMARDWPPLD
jgi:hypothetical protein